jgi:hypothetical protein
MGCAAGAIESVQALDEGCDLMAADTEPADVDIEGD